MSMHCLPYDIRMLEHWMGPVRGALSVVHLVVWISHGTNDIPSLLFINSGFLLADPSKKRGNRTCI